MKRFAFILLLAVTACQTTGERPTEPAAVTVAPTQGYFVALAAKGEAKAFYQRLYGLVDAYNRRLAREAGTLPAYAEAFAADGHTRLSDGASEIECDREKCLVKLTGRTLASRDPASLPGQLSRALGPAPLSRDGLRIACAGMAPYQCTFDLGLRQDGVASAALARGLGADHERDREKGRLVDCALAPGIARSAEEARADVDGGTLLKVTAGPGEGTKTVGYLLVGRGARGASELHELFLCGDLSEDHFLIEGAARSAEAWRRGGEMTDLTQGESTLVATARLLEGGAVQVRFRIDGPDAIGADHFYLHLTPPPPAGR